MRLPQILLQVSLLVLSVVSTVQCQNTGSTPSTSGDKLAIPAADKTKGTTKPEDKTKPDGGTSSGAPGSNPSGETPKISAAKLSPKFPLGTARLEALASDYASLSYTKCEYNGDQRKIKCSDDSYQVKVSDQGFRAQLKKYNVGDIVRIEVSDTGELQDLRGTFSYPAKDAPIHASCRLLVLAACGLVILGFAAAVTKGAPLKFIVGMDNRYSNSKFQLALWFWVALSAYLAVVVFRVWYAGWDFLGGVNIPSHLLELSGLSAITYGGAKAITTSKVNAAANPKPIAVAVAPPAQAPMAVAVGPVPAAAVGLAPPPPPPVAFLTPPANLNPKNAQAPGQESFFEDLIKNDMGGFDFGDFQMIVVTVVAVVMYLSLIFNFLGSIEFLKTTSLPDVDTTILAGFGLGQGAYLAKKAGGNVGTS